MKSSPHHNTARNNLRDLADGVSRLSRLFTRDRDNLPDNYLDDAALRTAYCAYFLPPNREKVRILLREITLPRDMLPPATQLKVLDFGSGPGSALLGILDFFAAQPDRPSLDCVAVDAVPQALKICRDLFEQTAHQLGMNASLDTSVLNRGNAALHIDGSFDLIVMANVVNELLSQREGNREESVSMLRQLINNSLAEHGICLIIEPALRETSRDLLLLRDALLAEGLTIAAPCLCATPCPALINPKDWCHEDIAWDAPEAIREIDRLTGLRKDSLKFSYLILRKDGRSLADLYGTSAFRVVSEPLVSKGKKEFYLCGSSGRKLATRLDKDGSPVNGPFEKLRRGSIVAFDGLLDEEKRYRIGKETDVRILRDGMLSR